MSRADEVYLVSEVVKGETAEVVQAVCADLDTAKAMCRRRYTVVPELRSDGTWLAYRTATDLIRIRRFPLRGGDL